ncbi:hypothetical protein BDV19DRAFT_369076 [Aspergillus venezuelensis]
MLNTWWSNAFVRGTKSWDQVTLYALATMMITATGARTGDISLSNGYDDSCSLCWSDVEMTLGHNTELKNVTLVLTLRFCKTQK